MTKMRLKQTKKETSGTIFSGKNYYLRIPITNIVKMKSDIVFLISVLLLAIVAGCKHKSFEDQFETEAKKQTAKMCPMQVAEGVTLDSIVFSRTDRSLRYYYQMEDTLYTDSAISENREKFREELLKQVNRSLDLKKNKGTGNHTTLHLFGPKRRTHCIRRIVHKRRLPIDKKKADVTQ